VITLDQVPPGNRATVMAVGGGPSLVQRLYELGLLEGETVEVVGLAPLGDPIEVRVGSTRLSLRRREAAAVTVSPG
jgi:ferrous iron transport protein A